MSFVVEGSVVEPEPFVVEGTVVEPEPCVVEPEPLVVEGTVAEPEPCVVAGTLVNPTVELINPRHGTETILVDRERVIFKMVQGKPLLPTQLPTIDGSWLWLRKYNDDLHRTTRKDAGELLRECFKAGGYAVDSGGQIKVVEFKRIKSMLADTKIVRATADLPALPPGQHQSLEISIARSPIDAAVDLTLQGYSVATVNAASAYHAGGGFTSGGRHALEEAFCSQSTLYPSLEKVVSGDGGMFSFMGSSPSQHSRFHAHIPQDGVIVSPSVEMFRKGTDQGYLLFAKPVEITAVISMAMYNRNPHVRDSPLDAPGDPAEYEEGVKKKFVALCYAAAAAGADALVLCDVGCGVFGNDASTVGRIAGNVVLEYGAHFRCITFTGKQDFSDAATKAITGVNPSTIAKPRLTRDAKIEPSVNPHNCIVCGRRLDKSLAILLDESGQRRLPQFLRKECAELVAEKWPNHTAMPLPDAAKDIESFFHALDVDGSGVLQKEEIKVVLAAFWDGSDDKFEAEFEERWADWEKDGDGAVDLEEFQTAHAPVPRLRRSGPADASRLDLDQLPTAILDWIKAKLPKDNID